MAQPAAPTPASLRWAHPQHTPPALDTFQDPVQDTPHDSFLAALEDAAGTQTPSYAGSHHGSPFTPPDTTLLFDPPAHHHPLPYNPIPDADYNPTDYDPPGGPFAMMSSLEFEDTVSVSVTAPTEPPHYDFPHPLSYNDHDHSSPGSDFDSGASHDSHNSPFAPAAPLPGAPHPIAAGTRSRASSAASSHIPSPRADGHYSPTYGLGFDTGLPMAATIVKPPTPPSLSIPGDAYGSGGGGGGMYGGPGGPSPPAINAPDGSGSLHFNLVPPTPVSGGASAAQAPSFQHSLLNQGSPGPGWLPAQAPAPPRTQSPFLGSHPSSPGMNAAFSFPNSPAHPTHTLSDPVLSGRSPYLGASPLPPPNMTMNMGMNIDMGGPTGMRPRAHSDNSLPHPAWSHSGTPSPMGSPGVNPRDVFADDTNYSLSTSATAGHGAGGNTSNFGGAGGGSNPSSASPTGAFLAAPSHGGVPRSFTHTQTNHRRPRSEDLAPNQYPPSPHLGLLVSQTQGNHSPSSSQNYLHPDISHGGGPVRRYSHGRSLSQGAYQGQQYMGGLPPFGGVGGGGLTSHAGPNYALNGGAGASVHSRGTSHERHASGGSSRASPYPSPNLSPRRLPAIGLPGSGSPSLYSSHLPHDAHDAHHGYNMLPTLSYGSMGPPSSTGGMSPVLGAGELGMGVPAEGANLDLTKVTRHSVTTDATAEASHRRRKGEANFHCPVPGCGSTFTRHFNLKGHMRSHNEEKPFVCKWPGCAKGFARQHDCKRHEQLHLNIRPYICEGCKKNFARMDALNRHLRSENGTECKRVQPELTPESVAEQYKVAEAEAFAKIGGGAGAGDAGMGGGMGAGMGGMLGMGMSTGGRRRKGVKEEEWGSGGAMVL